MDPGQVEVQSQDDDDTKNFVILQRTRYEESSAVGLTIDIFR